MRFSPEEKPTRIQVQLELTRSGLQAVHLQSRCNNCPPVDFESNESDMESDFFKLNVKNKIPLSRRFQILSSS